MPVKKNTPLGDDHKKIWGWFSDEDNEMHENMTLAQAEKSATEYKSKWPGETITIFKKVATVEVKPFIKGV